MKNTLFVLAAVLTANTALAQSPVATNFTSDVAGSVGMLIKFIGTASAATVEIDAGTGDIELEIADVADNTNVDVGGVCAGGVANSLDVSDAQCDTFGEVVDLINASTRWRAVLVGALRSDSTNNTLQTMAEVQATRTDGLTLYIDSAVSDWAGNPLVPQGCLTNIRCYMTPTGKLLENPFAGKRIALRYFAGLSTYDTSSTFNVYSVKVSNKASGSETASRILQTATGASTVSATLVALGDAPIWGRPSEKLLVRIESTAATSTFTIRASGEEYGLSP